MGVWVIFVLVFASAGLFCVAIWPDESTRRVRQRIAEVSDKTRPSAFTKLGALFAPINRRLPAVQWYTEVVSRWLGAAGQRSSPLYFLALQEFGMLTGVLVYFSTIGLGPINLPWLVLCIVGGAMIPVLWLTNQIQVRRMSVARDMPEVVDLLTLSVEAGSDFMRALARIVREFRPCPLRDELGVVLSEVRVGKRRRDALSAFARRVQSPEAATFSRTLIQADRMGTGLNEALSVLSEDMRLQRSHWAERFAQQAPMKMLVPLVFSLAAVMIIVAGPILVQFFRGGFLNLPAK